MPDPGSGLLAPRLLRRSLIGIAALSLGGIVIWGLQKASTGISFDAMVAALSATSPTALFASLAATFLSFIALLGYDLSGLRYAGARPPLTAVLLASFCGFAIGNTVGLGTFSGGAVRYRLYSAAGLSPGQIARVIFFIAIAFGIGLATITALGLVLRASPTMTPTRKRGFSAECSAAWAGNVRKSSRLSTTSTSSISIPSLRFDCPNGPNYG